MYTYRYSGGRFPQAGDESARVIVVNAPLSVVFFSLFCVFLVFAILVFGVSSTLNAWGRGLHGHLFIIPVLIGGALPFLAAYAVASNRKIARLLALLQIAGLGYLFGLLFHESANPLQWYWWSQVATVVAPVVGIVWLHGPTKAARYFDVLAGKPPHPCLMTGSAETPWLNKLLHWMDVAFEWIWIGLALFMAFGGLVMVYGL